MDDLSVAACLTLRNHGISSARNYLPSRNGKLAFVLNRSHFGCIKLSWCVFVLVNFAVNIFAQESTTQLRELRTATLQNEVLRYRMVSGQEEVGQVTVNIINDTGSELLQIVESISGLLERTTSLIVRKDSTLQSVSSHTVMVKEKFFQEIQLQYESAKVSGRVLQSERLGGPREVNATLATKTQDYFIVPYVLRSCVLQMNTVFKFPVYDALRDRVELARGWVAKTEEVEVPAGKFYCYRMEGFTGKLRWILYFDTEFPHRLIKQKWPALQIESELCVVLPRA